MPPYYRIKFREDVDGIFDEPQPWFARGAQDFLDKALNENMVGVEYGGGTSTPWLCHRLGELYTVEADHNWAIRLLDYMSRFEEFRIKWRMFFVNCTWHVDERGEVSATKGYWNKNIKKINVDQRRTMENSFFNFSPHKKVDFVIIDGALRLFAIRKAAELLNKNPEIIIAVDNTLGKNSGWADNILSSYHTHERLDFTETEVDRISRGADVDMTSIWVPRHMV